MAALSEPPVHNILAAAPLLIGLVVVDPGLQHTVKGAEICLLIFRVPGEFLTHLLCSGQGTADAADPGVTLVIEAAVGNTSGIEILPHIFLQPINDGIEGVHTFHHTGFQQAASLVIVVHQLDPRIAVAVEFQHTPAVFAAGARLGRRPTSTALANAGNHKPPLTAVLLEAIAAVANYAGRWHPLFDNQISHGNAGMLNRHMGVMLPHEIDNLGRVNGSQAVVGVEFHSGLPTQMVDRLAVLAAAECQIVTFRWLKGAEPVDSDSYLVMGAAKCFFYQHGDIT